MIGGAAPRRIALAIRHPKQVFYGWWMALAGTGLATYTDGVGFWGFSNFFAAIVREFGWSQAVAAIGPSLQRLEQGITAPITGIMVDRFGPRRVLFIGFTTAGFACILLSQIQNLWQYFGAFVVFAFGLSASSFFVTAAAINAWFRRYRGRANGIMLLGPGLSGLLAGLWAWLIPEFGWRTVLFGAGIGFWVIGYPLILLIRNNPESYGQEPDGGPEPPQTPDELARRPRRPQLPEADFPLRVVLRSRGYWQYVVSMSLMGASWAVITFEALVLTRNGLSTWMIAFMFTWQTVSSIPARLIAGTLADFIDKRVVLASAIVMQAAAVALFPFAVTPAIALIAGFLLGSSIGSQSPVRLSLQAEYWGRGIFGRVSGIQQGLASLPAIAAPIFIGWMYETTDSYRVAFLVVAATLLVAVPLTLTVTRPRVAATDGVAPNMSR